MNIVRTSLDVASKLKLVASFIDFARAQFASQSYPPVLKQWLWMARR